MLGSTCTHSHALRPLQPSFAQLSSPHRHIKDAHRQASSPCRRQIEWQAAEGNPLTIDIMESFRLPTMHSHPQCLSAELANREMQLFIVVLSSVKELRASLEQGVPCTSQGLRQSFCHPRGKRVADSSHRPVPGVHARCCLQASPTHDVTTCQSGLNKSLRNFKYGPRRTGFWGFCSRAAPQTRTNPAQMASFDVGQGG